MTATIESSIAGIPVEIGMIDRELKKLWDQNDGAKTRASLINLALYSEEAGSLPRNTEIISQITEDHACRAIVISAKPAAETNRVEAWISAHCHIGRAGDQQVCSEQLSFLLEGPSAKLLPSIVFSQLDSDLPFNLWWQGEFHDPMDPQLWAWVDRLIYDSQSWSDFAAQLQCVETAQADAKQRVVLCDLNWTRLVQMRLAVAQFFDHPAAQNYFEKIESVEIDFAPGFRSTAILLAGWLAAQLRWNVPRKNGDGALQFRANGERQIAVSLHETAGEPVSRCAIHCGEVSFCAAHAECGDLLEVSAIVRGEVHLSQLLPAGRNDPVALMKEELMRGGPHRVYVRALNCVRALL